MDKITCFIVNQDRRHVLLTRDPANDTQTKRFQLGLIENDLPKSKSAVDIAKQAITRITGLVVPAGRLCLLKSANRIVSRTDDDIPDAQRYVSVGTDYAYMLLLNKNDEYSINVDPSHIDEALIWADMTKLIAHNSNSGVIRNLNEVKAGLIQIADILGIEITPAVPTQTSTQPQPPVMTSGQIHRHIANYLSNDLGLNKQAVSAMIEQQVARHDIPAVIDRKVKALIGKPGNKTYEQYLEQRLMNAIDQRLDKIITDALMAQLRTVATDHAADLAEQLRKLTTPNEQPET